MSGPAGSPPLAGLALIVLRPQIMDAIVTHLQSVGEPVKRQELVSDLNAQGAGIEYRIKRAMAHHLRSGNLVLFPRNKIGLPEWKDREQGKSDQTQ